MTAHAQANIVKFYSKMEPFRVAEKYTDVTIKCDDKYFKCHRLTLATASELFDNMFSSSSIECKEKHILLREVSSETLEEVLRFVYTGDVSITSSNVYNLFKASKFFVLSGIEDLCFEFIKQNTMTVKSTLNMFLVACYDKNEKLIDILSQDIVNQLNVFAKASAFLELSYSNFKMIVDKSKLSKKNEEELLLGVVSRWLLHRREERAIYSKDLFKMIRFECISSAIVRFLMSKHHMNSDAAELSVETIDPIGYNEFTAVPKKAISSVTPAKELHIYVKYAEENFMRVHSIDNERICTSSEEIHLKDSSQWIRTVSLNDHLFALHYARRNSGKINSNQIFCAYTAADMRSSLELNTPPIVFGDVSMCSGQNNNIYVYHQTLFQPLIKTNSPCSVMFNDEEMNRGLYCYNGDLDIWLPVPPMKRELEDACMMAYNDLLYLIGGTSNLPDFSSARFVQTYDFREGWWQELPCTGMDRVGADCCLFNGQIYVCGGKSQATSVERYDLRARRWECLTMAEKMNLEMQYHRLISYNNVLWAMGSFNPGGSKSIDSLSVQSYPNRIDSTIECNGCQLKKFYCDRNDCDFIDCQFGHYSHQISTSILRWMKEDILQNVNHLKTGNILDAIVF